MTKKKPTTVKEWEKVCENLNSALQSMMKDEAALKEKIKELEVNFTAAELDQEVEHLDAQIEQLEEQLTMSVGVIKYLEMKLERPNSV
jgi:predicted RNase H-like nuclease (RuvC/YqgF family)